MVPCTVEMVKMVQAHLQRRLILIAGHPVQVSATPDGLTFNAGSVTTRKLSQSPQGHTTRCGVNWGLRPQDMQAA